MELLTADQMQAVDARASAADIDTFALMTAAGCSVADEISQRFSNQLSVVVVAGTGNNGGDGAIAADMLCQMGFAVSLVRYAPDKVRQHDAIRAFSNCKLPFITVTDVLDEAVQSLLGRTDIIVDALLGAGLTREPEGVLARLIAAINDSAAKTVAVDLPSGVDGNAHTVAEFAIKADLTVTFFRCKVAHVLMPAKALCGEVALHQIGLDESHLSSDDYPCELNISELWRGELRPPSTYDHKYTRGHVLVRGGGADATGAARLSAQSALHCGAGVVTLSCPTNAIPVYAAHLTAVMINAHDDVNDFNGKLLDERVNTVALGPGNGVGDLTKQFVLASLDSGKRCVLDADALSSFADDAQIFFAALSSCKETAVLTPHHGEFRSLFSELAAKPHLSRLHLALAAAKECQAVVVFKGNDTVIASPDGRSRINNSAPPWLATAGSGDVLTGVISAMRAMGMSAFDAASAGVWLHANAANQLTFPMTAEQLCVQVQHSVSSLCQSVT